MVTQSQDGRPPAHGPGQRGVYVYGILRGDIELEPGGTGVGDPPGEIRVVRHGGLAALVSDVDLDRPLGRPEDLMTHEELLDSSAAEVPVLPLRFGSVAASDEVVAAELLAHVAVQTNVMEEVVALELVDRGLVALADRPPPVVLLEVEALVHGGGGPRRLLEQEVDDSQTGDVLVRLVEPHAVGVGRRVRHRPYHAEQPAAAQ